MSRERAGAYHEAEKRIQESMKDTEKTRLNDIQEHFEKRKKTLETKEKFSIFSLRHQIETGKSLISLRKEIRDAFSHGEISKEQYTESMRSIESQDEKQEKKEKDESKNMFSDDFSLPFENAKIGQFLENQRLWENIWADILWFLYGFAVQGSAILVILLWRIITDAILLPKDILDTIHNSQK